MVTIGFHQVVGRTNHIGVDDDITTCRSSVKNRTINEAYHSLRFVLTSFTSLCKLEEELVGVAQDLFIKKQGGDTECFRKHCRWVVDLMNTQLGRLIAEKKARSCGGRRELRSTWTLSTPGLHLIQVVILHLRSSNAYAMVSVSSHLMVGNQIKSATYHCRSWSGRWWWCSRYWCRWPRRCWCSRCRSTSGPRNRTWTCCRWRGSLGTSPPPGTAIGPQIVGSPAWLRSSSGNGVRWWRAGCTRRRSSRRLTGRWWRCSCRWCSH